MKQPECFVIQGWYYWLFLVNVGLAHCCFLYHRIWPVSSDLFFMARLGHWGVARAIKVFEKWLGLNTSAGTGWYRKWTTSLSISCSLSLCFCLRIFTSLYIHVQWFNMIQSTIYSSQKMVDSMFFIPLPLIRCFRRFRCVCSRCSFWSVGSN